MFCDYQITGNEAEDLSGLVPDFYIRQLKDSRIFGILTMDSEEDEAEPVGIVLYRVTDAVAEIEEVFLTDSYSLPDYGRDLVQRFILSVRMKGGIRGVSARFREGDRIEQFFRRELFHRKTQESPVLRFVLADVEELAELTENAKLKNCVCLGDADWRLKNRFERDWSEYDQQLSAIYEENGHAAGILLISEEGSELVIRLLHADDPVACVSLLGYAFAKAKERFPGSQMITCPVLNRESEDLVYRIANEVYRDEFICAELHFPAGKGTGEDYERYCPAEEAV